MKLSYKTIFSAMLLAGVGLGFSSCDDWLDTPPQDSITGDEYFTNADQLGAYAIRYYGNMFSTSVGTWSIGSPYLDDNGTDNAVGNSPNQNYYTADHWKTVNSGNLNTSLIRYCNYFFDQVLPKYEAGYYTTNIDLVRHYIGEMYFQRAWIYFQRLQTYGDYPIITAAMSESDDLISIGERKPRNEVCDFILSDLDKAIDMLKDKGFESNNRINKQVAQLVKSRVALYEASYERYHKGSGRVPGDTDWPGYSVHPSYTLNVDAHVNSLLQTAMTAAQAVADNITLTNNTGVYYYEDCPEAAVTSNPYIDMYAYKDMSGVNEILMWRAYGDIDGQSIVNGIGSFTASGSNYGLLKGYVESFLMGNGLPIYAANSGYHGDVTLDDVKADRDGRLQLFLFGESNWVPLMGTQTTQRKFSPLIGSSQDQTKDITGYRMRKGANFDKTQNIAGKPMNTQGTIIFRGVEAMLNYMEAQYMKDGNVNSTSANYWRAIRNRAGVDEDFNKTIAATDMHKEAVGDWGAYSHGQLVDATLYNIRRERRCEFIGEGMRWDDLIRWCSMDQLKTTRFIPEGVNFWDKMYLTATYNGENDYPVEWIEGPTNERANVSAKSDSKYLRPFRVHSNNAAYEGYTWMEAHYNQPIAIREIELLSPDGTIENSKCYQTWGWATTANEPALK